MPGLALAALLATSCQGAPPPPSVSLSGRSYVIQMTHSQVASGLASYLVPPLRGAFDGAGLVYRGGPGAEFAASITPGSDVGDWSGSGGSRRWLYTRTVLVGLSPADAPFQDNDPLYGVNATLVTPDADRVDELNCLVALAVCDLVANYQPRGRRQVDGSACARK